MDAPENTDVPAPREAGPGPDADSELVLRAQGGDLEAFEELVRRHQRRIYRTLIGITGNPEDAEDGAQNVFLKTYLHIRDFQGGSRFSTWLMRIAINEGLERLRKRKNVESLDEPEETEEGFRPRRIQDWRENPEEAYSRTELREMVEQEVMKLPAKYRLVVMLRDIDELSTEEAAAALGLGIPALKTRLLRARLMLREALAPHFIRKRQEAPSV